MDANVVFCQAHQAKAIEFCLCAQVPEYLCVNCLPKHKDQSSHDVFPMANLGIYKALGNDKAELIRRVETVKKCNEFLDKASVRETAVMAEANNLMTDLTRRYQVWLQNNHRCFINLVEVLREEVALLLTAHEMALSPLSHMLVNRCHSLSAKEESLLCTIPEEKSLKEIVQHCNQALTKARKVQQQEYENVVQEAFMTISQRVKASGQGVKAPAQTIKEEVKSPARTFKEVNAPAQTIKEVKASAQTIKEDKTPPQTVKEEVQVPTQTVKEEVKAPAQRAIVPAQGDAQKLIAVLQDKVNCFNVATSQWEQLLKLRMNINMNEYTSSTFVAPNTIYVCGGGPFYSPCTCHAGNNAYVLEGDGCVQELRHMSIGRRVPGLAWDSVRQALYVFGGRNSPVGTCYTGYLRASEMFMTKWLPLPDMHQGRGWFNPCWHSSLVYLCGGYTNIVETYDPRSNTFALQDFTLPESSWTTAVVECGALTVISEGYISKLQQGSLTSQQHGEYSPWSNCTPLVSGEVLYIVDLYRSNCCRMINLINGALQKEVRLG